MKSRWFLFSAGLLALMFWARQVQGRDPVCHPFVGAVFVEAPPQIVEIAVEGCTEDFHNFPAVAQ